jgi:hypothetical protein
MSNSLSTFVGAGSAIFVLLMLSSVGSVITYIIIVVANRADPDPTGKRPMAVYFFGGAFLTLWVAYIGLIAIVVSLVSLIGTNITYNFGSSEQHPVGDTAIRGVSLGLIFFLIAGFMHYQHRRRGLELAASETDPSSPTKRVARSYVAVVSFMSVLIAIITSVTTIYTLLTLVAPGIYHGGNRTSTLKGLIVELFILGLAAVIFWTHQNLAPSGLRLFSVDKMVPPTDVVSMPE